MRLAIHRCGAKSCAWDGRKVLVVGRRESAAATSSSSSSRAGFAHLHAPRPKRMSSPAASDTTLDAASEAADSVCAGPAAASALPLVLPLLPPDAWICAAATCRSWRAAVAAVPGRWAVLDFRGCAVRVNRDALVTLCARAGAELRELRLDAPACNSLWSDSIITALENGGCRGLRRYTQPLTSPAGEQWSPFGEYAHPPFGIKPRYAVALARVCPALEHAACRVLLRYSWDVLALSEVPGPVTLVLPNWGWRASKEFETLSLPRSIAALDVHSAYMGNEGAVVFSKALSEDGSSVASVDFSSNHHLTDTGVRSLAEMLRVNTTLKDLNLLHNYFYDDGVAALGEALRVNATLTRLVLSNNPAGDNGAASLAAALLVNTGLKDLQLRGTSIGLAGATALAEALMVNRTLTSVDLGFNEDIRNAGAVKFAHMLEDNSTLRSLDLSACNINDLGANAIGQALQDNTALTSLDLSYNKLTDECLASIAAAMTRANATLLNLNLRRAAADAKALLEQSSDGSRQVATELRLLLFSQDVIASEDNASSV